MSQPQQGDVFLFQTTDDGEINVENGVIEMSGGLDTSVYLSLQGGNEDDNGSDDNQFTWWGNHSEADKASKYISETQHLLQSLPATTNNLRRIEQAATRDTQWLLDKKVASSVVVIASIPALNRIKIIVTTEANGVESSFTFAENWKVSV